MGKIVLKWKHKLKKKQKLYTQAKKIKERAIKIWGARQNKNKLL